VRNFTFCVSAVVKRYPDPPKWVPRNITTVLIYLTACSLNWIKDNQIIIRSEHINFIWQFAYTALGRVHIKIVHGKGEKERKTIHISTIN